MISATRAVGLPCWIDFRSKLIFGADEKHLHLRRLVAGRDLTPDHTALAPSGIRQRALCTVGVIKELIVRPAFG